MTSNLRALVLTVGCLCVLSRPVHGAGKYLQVEYPASTAADELQIAVTYTMWVPDDVARFRCVIVHQHGAGRNAAEHGGTAAYDLHWQALAKKWDCALLGPFYHVLTDATDASPGGSELWFDPRRGSDKTFLKALDELSAQAKHPELATVPWALWGHSGGGIWSDVMTTLHPDTRGCGVPAIRLVPEPAKLPAARDAGRRVCGPGYGKRRRGRAGTRRMDQHACEDPRISHARAARPHLPPIHARAMRPATRVIWRFLTLTPVLAMRLPAKDSKSQKLNPVDMSKGWLAPFLGDNGCAGFVLQGQRP